LSGFTGHFAGSSTAMDNGNEHFYDMWRKAHPDMELGTTFEQYDKLRHQGDVDIFVVQDYIVGGLK
jgi:hypothetical protein